ncbi:ABC transporter ATP-binding protein [Variovorax terrae]|uniref:ABC transporter ATP-binding protein/permease n=1 Tax=Variovorax terrae TaxID=2923278 RepID=A0A9X2AMT4_9BURK|nr:ABC transporter ATP-binding protein [Variovorax terrae]MCJ0764073.1 ABC transporter ATP-binding protein/permease [Variovorax terrae]
MFKFFETRVADVTAPPGVADSGPPRDLLAFYWHFIRQTRGLYLAMLATGLCVALIDTLIPVFIGKLVGLMTAADPAQALQAQAHVLAGIALVLLLGRPLVILLDSLVRNNAVIPGVTTLIRWQSHWHVVRQGAPFFQNDFAGRIANRVMNTANSLRESVVAAVRAVWYIMVYGLGAMSLMLAFDWRLALPTLAWILGYLLFLRHFVPRMRDLSRVSSEARSLVMGRVVDSYTNILTVKLFSRAQAEDAYVREAIDDHRGKIAAHMRMTTGFMFTLTLLNALLLVSTAGIGLWLWASHLISPAVVATALPLVWQIANMAGWVSWEVSGIFENVGVVQEGIESIAVPHSLVDAPQAGALRVPHGDIRFENVRFSYGRQAGSGRPVIDGLNLHIRAGERVGLVGRSGAGKSTLMNLLLRFHDVEGGHIRIDGQDLREVTQESLRAAIGTVTQDTSLLHRSIAANIRYGRPEATLAQVQAAAARAHAHEFIEELNDWKGRTGYEAHAGERGVKLSGGQRQRVALARVVLKDAPILILDEATSALDSEVEAAIQEQLTSLMQGKTVIAIAHRLSTIARMERLVVMDAGRIVEQGTHQELLQLGGHYAKLWRRQSGGFLATDLGEDEAPEAVAA